jgi:hypothetical protein
MVERWEDAGRPELGCAGGMFEHHVPLSVEATTPRGGLLDLPWMTEDDIEQFAAALLEHERGMRLRGDWEPVLSGRWLSAYDKAASVHGFRLGRLPGPPAGASLFVGIDHGAGIGKQAAALVAVHQVDTLAPRVWVLDCHVAQGYTTPEQDWGTGRPTPITSRSEKGTPNSGRFWPPATESQKGRRSGSLLPRSGAGASATASDF